ncbi:alanine racemase [Pelagerythrobacter rhizovicinus]|uniref:Alanine racemase n=1 Tax=Pelagerythrobacter rhizovicinus TaxID=2268576 RepID=A0A4Q2KLD6_9SPHN|nr:alanine racemase [Pelagerythrobacter rhizovicinus]RXZ66118.1 alanine racemase [Pelagerythrobacter rhizovicinus]
MPDLPPPSLRLRLDKDALANNWRTLDSMSGTASAGAAVKADAYGLGANEVVPVLRKAGVRDFFVAHWSEAPDVLRHVPPAQVAVLHGPVRPDDAAFANAAGITPVINSLGQAKRWADAGGGRCHLMVDTGINRLGVPLAEIHDPAIAALQIDLLMSHLASADEESALNARQLERFRSACAAVPARRRSLANSAGIALGPDFAFDLTRPGLALYGGVPRDEFAGSVRQVAFPQAAVIQVRELAAGDTVGYNATFTARKAMRAGIVSLGYADGFLRCRGAGGVLRCGEARLPLLGKVSMDMIVVDLADAPEVQEGDWLEIPFDLAATAEISGLSQYELLTTLGRRFRP